MSGELLPPGRRLLKFANDLTRKHMRMSASTYIPGPPLLKRVFTLFEMKWITSVALTLTHTHAVSDRLRSAELAKSKRVTFNQLIMFHLVH